MLIPDGRNADGSFKNIDYTLNANLSTGEFSSAGTRLQALNSSTINSYTDLITQEDTPNAGTLQFYLWYKPSTNLYYSSNGSVWASVSVIPICYSTTDSSGVVTSLTTFTHGYTDRILTSRTHHIIESWSSGTSGYDKYSNGKLVQWGTIS